MIDDRIQEIKRCAGISEQEILALEAMGYVIVERDFVERLLNAWADAEDDLVLERGTSRERAEVLAEVEDRRAEWKQFVSYDTGSGEP